MLGKLKRSPNLPEFLRLLFLTSQFSPVKIQQELCFNQPSWWHVFLFFIYLIISLNNDGHWFDFFIVNALQ